MSQYVKVLAHDGTFYGPIRTRLLLAELSRLIGVPEGSTLRSLLTPLDAQSISVISDQNASVPPGVYEIPGRPRRRTPKLEEALRKQIQDEVAEFQRLVGTRGRRASSEADKTGEASGEAGGERLVLEYNTASRRGSKEQKNKDHQLAHILPATSENTLMSSKSRQEITTKDKAIARRLDEAMKAAYHGGMNPENITQDRDALGKLLREVEYCFFEFIDLVHEAGCIAGPGSKPVLDIMRAESVRNTLSESHTKLVEIYGLLGASLATTHNQVQDPSKHEKADGVEGVIMSNGSHSSVFAGSSSSMVRPKAYHEDVRSNEISYQMPYSGYQGLQSQHGASHSSLNFASMLNALATWRREYLHRTKPLRYDNVMDYTDPQQQAYGRHQTERAHMQRRVLAITTLTREQKKSPVHSYKVAPVYFFRRVVPPRKAFTSPPPVNPASRPYRLNPSQCIRSARRKLLEAVVQTGSHHDEDLNTLINLVVDLEAAAAKKSYRRDVLYPTDAVRETLRKEFDVRST